MKLPTQKTLLELTGLLISAGLPFAIWFILRPETFYQRLITLLVGLIFVAFPSIIWYVYNKLTQGVPRVR